MNSQEHIRYILELTKLERQADLDQYRQKVLLKSITQRTKEGTTWYPLRLKRTHIGTGERLIAEVERTNHLDQPHSFQSGKLVSVFSNASGKPEKEHVNGVINYVRDNQMVLTLNADELPDWIEDGLIGVDVMFDEMSYREMEHALKEVMKGEGRLGDLREIILGEGKLQNRSVEKFPSADFLNDSQYEALTKVLSAADVALIHGPPGTGKTTTLVQSIAYTIRQEGQVLVCAPSNAAVDLLAEKLDEKGIRVVRIGHPARVTEQTLSKTLDARIAENSNYPELRNLRKKMEQIKAQAFKFKRTFGHHEKAQRKALQQEAKILKADADMLEFYIINEVLNNSEAICCTLVGSSHPVLRGRKFKTVFIDEAGQALEPACWIPILRSSRLILAGDHQQLPPTVKSKEAAVKGLTVTLFEKIVKRHATVASLLRVQYRMHEDIMAFPSSWFYHNQLIAHESVRKRTLLPHEPPIDFIDTAGSGYFEKQDPETLSRFNEKEAELLIYRVEQLISQVGPEAWLESGISMAIITPYRAQVDLLHVLAKSSTLMEPLSNLFAINTVDSFQGQERDVIAISFVRSNESGETGFLNDIRRTNVAMTRARKKLIMIGDSATLGSNPFYISLIDYVQAKGFYRSAFEIT